MVELSNALNNNGKISDRMSSCGVFSKMICRFSNIVTVAWIDFGAAKTTLRREREKKIPTNEHQQSSSCLCFWLLFSFHFLKCDINCFSFFSVHDIDFSFHASNMLYVMNGKHSNLNVGNKKFSYSFCVASATNDNAGCRTAANTSPNRISCCKHGQICCHHSFYKYNYFITFFFCAHN